MSDDGFPFDTEPGLSSDTPPKNTHLAVVAYIPFLCFIALFSRESDAYSRAHGRQGLILFLLEVIAVIMLLPIGAFFWKMLLLACIVASLAGIVYAATGKPFKLPWVGQYADRP